MLKQLAKGLFKLALYFVYHSYKVSGLNALFLFLPAQLLIATLKQYGAQIGQEVEMQTPVIFHNVSEVPKLHYSNLKIGSKCYFGKEVFFDLADHIIVEDNVTVSMRVLLLTHTHAGQSPLTTDRLRPSYAPIVLERGCYLGAGAIILPGIRVGEKAIVAAGAVVTHNVLPGETVAGVPARPATEQTS